VDPANAERRLRELATAWRATWGRLGPKTKVGYESILASHVLPRWGDARVGAISPEAVQDWINGLAKDRQPNTVRRIHSVLRAVLGLAVKRHYLTVNPCDAVELPRGNGQKEMLFLTATEVAKLADAIHPTYRVLIFTAAYTGLRAGELGALRRRDVDLLHSRITVRQSLKDINTASGNIAEEDKGLIFGATKTGRTRQVGLPRFLREMLAVHLEGRPGGSDALVFTATEGGALRHGNFYRRYFKPAVRRALPTEKHGLRFHDLRHTCAALLIAADAHPKAIQDHLGHRDIQTTFNVYGHLLPAAREALTAALDATYEADLAGPTVGEPAFWDRSPRATTV
jgi:integrase